MNIKKIISLFNNNTFILLFLSLQALSALLTATGIINIVHKIENNSLHYSHFFMFSSFLIVAFAINITTRLHFIEFVEKKMLSILTKQVKSILSCEFNEFEKIPSKEIKKSINDDIELVTNGLDAISRTTQSIFLLLAMTIVSFFFSKTLLMALVIILTSWIIFYKNRLIKGKTLAIKSENHESRLASLFMEFIDGFKELKADKKKLKNLADNDLTNSINKNCEINNRKDFFSAKSRSLSIVFFMGGMLAYTYIAPSLGMTGNFLIAISILSLVWPEIMNINANINQILKADNALTNILELQKRITCKKFYRSSLKLPENNTLFYKNIQYSYEKGNFFVGPVDFHISPGEIIFITGSNGSGKSTLLKLFTGLYPTDNGEIKLKSNTLKSQDLLSLFTAIFSDYYLNKDLIYFRENEIPTIEKLLSKMKISHKTKITKNTFTTTELSSGQQRRLAMIEALIQKRPFFIFDEWTADQDPEFREYFYNDILPAIKKEKKAAIIITHDEQYFHIADRIYSMKEGKLIQLEVGRSLQKPRKPSPNQSTPPPHHQPLPVATTSRPQKINLKNTTINSILGSLKKESKLIFSFLAVYLFCHISFKNTITSDIINHSFGLQHLAYLLATITTLLIYDIKIKKIFVSWSSFSVKNIRNDFLKAYMSMKYEFYEKHKNQLFRLSYVETKKINFSLDAIIETTVIFIIFCAFSFWIMFVSVPAFLICIALICCLILSLIFIQHKETQLALFTNKIDEIFSNHQSTLVYGKKELTLYPDKRKYFFHKLFLPNIKNRCKTRTKSKLLSETSVTLMDFFRPCLLIMLSLLTLNNHVAHDDLITIIPFVLGLPVTLFMNVSVINDFLKSISKTTNFIDRIQRHKIQQAPTNNTHFNSMKIDEIIYHYTDSSFQFGPVSLNLTSGKIHFITGGNGSGKSTLFKLITNLYRPSSGKIYINDDPIKDTDYGQLFSIVFADPFIFKKIYGIDSIDKKRLDTLLAQFMMSDKVQYMNNQFTTTTNLSSGQKKRLALIVALLEDRPVLLLDEWAAEQDPLFREYFYIELLPSLKQSGKTIIAITHDDQYFHVADNIIKLDYGKIDSHNSPKHF